MTSPTLNQYQLVCKPPIALEWCLWFVAESSSSFSYPLFAYIEDGLPVIHNRYESPSKMIVRSWSIPPCFGHSELRRNLFRSRLRHSLGVWMKKTRSAVLIDIHLWHTTGFMMGPTTPLYIRVKPVTSIDHWTCSMEGRRAKIPCFWMDFLKSNLPGIFVHLGETPKHWNAPSLVVAVPFS